MLGYMTSKAEGWMEGEWIPNTWQRAEQVGALDRAITGFKQWIIEIKGLVQELNAAESSTYTDYGYEGPYGDTYAVQYPRGVTAYEGAYADDYDLDIIKNPQDYDEVTGVDDENFVTYLFPQPSSPTLVGLEREFFDIYGEYVWAYEVNPDVWKSLARWEDPDGDPADYAHDFAELLDEIVSQAESQGLPALSAIRQKWVEELKRLENKAHEDYIRDAYDDGAYHALRFIEDAVQLTDEAINAIEEATPTRAEEEIKMYARAIQEMAVEAEDVPGMMQDDVGFLKGAVEDIRQIAGQSHHSDIRAWEARGVQKDDAILSIDRIRSYFTKQLAQMSDVEHVKKINRFATAKGAGTVPSYRFKVGQMVKVRKSKRYGKVIGAKLEGGTGRQVYEVRVNGIDNAKNYYTDELERAE